MNPPRPALATLVAAALGAFCVLGFAPVDAWFAVWPAPPLALGGLVIHHLGRLPKRNEVVSVGGLRIQVLRADSRRVHTLLVDPQEDLPRAAAQPGGE